MRVKIQLPDWFDVFSAICHRGHEPLQWDLPEAWVHAELYAELKRRAPSSGWMPFSTEVPYVTFCPVQLPKKTNRDWKIVGAVKWVDLCLHSEAYNAWCWFEFKVRHVGEEPSRYRNAALEARNAFRKDVVALMGFDLQLTANTWANPDIYTIAYWFENHLKPNIQRLRSGRHHFVAAFLQLGGKPDREVWNKRVLLEQIHSWKAYRCKQAGRQLCDAGIDIAILSKPIMENYWLVVLGCRRIS